MRYIFIIIAYSIFFVIAFAQLVIQTILKIISILILILWYLKFKKKWLNRLKNLYRLSIDEIGNLKYKNQENLYNYFLIQDLKNDFK